MTKKERRRKKECYVLAKKIHEIEEDFWNNIVGKDKWKLTENVTLEQSNDKMMWYLWKRFPDQVRSFWKCVPATDLPEKNIAKILIQQYWECI